MADRKMTIAEVATALGVGVIRVRQLDDQLSPERIGPSKMRLYDPKVVERVKRERAKAKRAS